MKIKDDGTTIEELKDDIFVYRTMSVAFRVGYDKLLDDFIFMLAEYPEIKEVVIKALMHRVDEAQRHIEAELDKEMKRSVLETLKKEKETKHEKSS